eukprot:3215023-Pleurochrysis_carterae.AAC.1
MERERASDAKSTLPIALSRAAHGARASRRSACTSRSPWSKPLKAPSASCRACRAGSPRAFGGRLVPFERRVQWWPNDERAALRLVKFNVATHFSVLEFTEHIAYNAKRERQVSSGVAHHKHYVELSCDAFTDAAHGGTKLLRDQGITKTGMCGQRPIEASVIVATNKKGFHHGHYCDAGRRQRSVGFVDKDTDQYTTTVLALRAVRGASGQRANDGTEYRFHELPVNVCEDFGRDNEVITLVRRQSTNG